MSTTRRSSSRRSEYSLCHCPIATKYVHLVIQSDINSFIFPLDQAHELLPRESGSKAPAIIIHTCDDIIEENPNQIPREKLIRPTLVQTKRPPPTTDELA